MSLNGSSLYGSFTVFGLHNYWTGRRKPTHSPGGLITKINSDRLDTQTVKYGFTDDLPLAIKYTR